jgi:hypothetical protein
MIQSLLPVAALVAALGTVSVPTAEATTIVPLTTDQLVDASDTVVRGTVTEVWTERDPDSGYVWTHAQVEVSNVLKGDDAELLIIQQPGGEWAGSATTVAGTARFSVGEDAYFFVEHLESGRSVTTGMFQGKFNTQMDPYSRQVIVHRFPVSATTEFDHRFIPLPSEDQRVNTIDFEDHIMTRVESGWDGQPISGVSTEKLSRINNLQDGIR